MPSPCQSDQECSIISSQSVPHGEPELILRRETSLIAATGFGLLLLSTWFLGQRWTAWSASAWLLMAATCWSLVIWRCWQQLGLNRSLDGAIHYAHLGQGNLLTLLRGFLISATAGFLIYNQQLIGSAMTYWPAVLYTAAAIGDALDGYIARRQQQITQLGAKLDNELDALGLLIAPLLAVTLDKLHSSYLLVSIAYYLFQLGKLWRRRHNKPLYPLPPSRLRRHLAGWQMGLVATCLWPPIPGDLTRILGFVFMTPLLFGFVRDWLFVSGRLGAPANPEAE